MRGLCRLTAGLLTLVRANTFVLPPEEAIDRLHDASRDTLAAGQAAPLSNDDAGLDIGSIDSSELDVQSPNNPTDEDEETDPVQAWLDGLDSPETSTGSILSASLFPSMTVSPVIDFITSAAEEIQATPSPSHVQLSESPSPTSLDWHPLDFAHGEQKILGGLGEAWQVATSKAHSVVALIASHITNCPSASKTEAQPEAVTSVSSTISARSVEATRSATHTPIANAHDQGYSSVVDAASSAIPLPVEEAIQKDPFSSVVDTRPADDVITASPAHYTPSSGAATATATATATASSLVIGSPKPWSNPVIQQTQAGVSAQDEARPVSSAPTSDPRYILAIVIPVVLTLILSCTILFILIRRDPRRLAETRARCEERKNRRLYEHAARKYQIWAWKQATLARAPFKWFFSRPEEDLAEKGLIEAAPIIAVTAGPSNRVSQEIASFREAHDFVNTLVQAEEGGWSSRNHRRTYTWLFGGRARRQRAISNASSDLSDGERSAPPPYEERENYEKIEPRVYTRAPREEAQDSDKSSVSSIIPTSPRHSAITFSTGDPDSDKE